MPALGNEDLDQRTLTPTPGAMSMTNLSQTWYGAAPEGQGIALGGIMVNAFRTGWSGEQRPEGLAKAV